MSGVERGGGRFYLETEKLIHNAQHFLREEVSGNIVLILQRFSGP